MTAFDYIAFDHNGRKQKGVLEADSARHLRQLLRDRQMAPLSFRETMRAQSGSQDRKPVFFARFTQSIGLREISIFTRQLATMIQAGLPMAQALQALSRQHENPRVKSTLTSLHAFVREGKSLAESLASFPGSFSELYRASVHAGESTGHLGIVLEHLADFIQSSYQARQRVLLALLYPAILSAVSLVIILFLLTYIVPDLVRVFAGAGQSLPLLTRGLIALNDFLKAYYLIVLLGLGLLFFLLRKAFRIPDARLKLDKYMLRWPVVGKLSLQYASASFSSTLGMLHESGVPLVQALEISSATLSNRHLRSMLRHIFQEVREGQSLSDAIRRTEIFPPILVTMVGSGEASGELGHMLQRASSIQQRDLEDRISLLLGFFEPMVLLIMGGIVLLLVLAIIMPVLNLNQLVK